MGAFIFEILIHLWTDIAFNKKLNFSSGHFNDQSTTENTLNSQSNGYKRKSDFSEIRLPWPQVALSLLMIFHQTTFEFHNVFIPASTRPLNYYYQKDTGVVALKFVWYLNNSLAASVSVMYNNGCFQLVLNSQIIFAHFPDKIFGMLKTITVVTFILRIYYKEIWVILRVVVSIRHKIFLCVFFSKLKGLDMCLWPLRVCISGSPGRIR